MNAATLIGALSMGFLGSLHCAGMCGPIMLVMPFQLLSGWRKVAGISLYHSGRISIYAMMGLVLHSFRALFQPQWQQYLSMALGALLLGLGATSFIAGGRRAIKLPWLNFVKRQSSKVFGNPAPGALVMAGMLNGLLPCGLVYMALALAATAGSPMAAAATMYTFGVGTMPMLLSIILLKAKAPFFTFKKLRVVVPFLMFAFGGVFLLRGMNLGIPYFSPRISISNHTIKNTCCHKP